MFLQNLSQLVDSKILASYGHKQAVPASSALAKPADWETNNNSMATIAFSIY
jgi:hypothetical protein